MKIPAPVSQHPHVATQVPILDALSIEDAR